MIQPNIKFFGMLLCLGILAGCSSSGGGGGSNPAPTATLTASPTSFTANQGGSVLTFHSTNATQGSIDQGVGPVGVNSSVQVTPALTTIYTYTATGSGGTAVAKATVTVIPEGPPPTVTLNVSSGSIFAGQSVTLSWQASNATSLVLYADGASLQAVQPVSSGSVQLSPTTATTYTLVATGDGQQTTSAPATVAVSALNSFDGIPADTPLLGDQPQDVDSNGAVGTKQYMQYVNIEYQAYDKVTNTPVWSSPQPIGTPFMASLNSGDLAHCDGHTISTGLTGIHLDAVINFDRLAQRWIIMGKSDFAGAYYLCLAVSNTDDLTSASLGWYAYEFPLTSSVLGTDSGVLNFPDWAKLGTWSDGYYVTMDLQDANNSYAEIGIAICVFDRTDILAQTNASPPAVLGPACTTPPVSLDSASGTYLGHSIIPADIDGLTPPPAGRPEYMVSIENPSIANGQTSSSVINLWKAQVDWAANPPTLTVVPAQLSVDPFTPGCYLYAPNPAITNCVPELKGNQSSLPIIDSNGDRLMPRFPYRNFGSYESYLVSHTVQTGPGSGGTNPSAYQTGIRWYELRMNGSSPYIYQQNTVNPDSVLFRFLPSIAQDKNGNAVVGYSISNALSDPGIDFSFWNLGTPSATPTEVTIFNGTGAEITVPTLSNPGGYGEWGTYSSLTVDPYPPSNDCTFWYTNEYYATDSDHGWSTRIANFTIPGCQ